MRIIKPSRLREFGDAHARARNSLEHWHEIAARLAGMEGVRRNGPTSVPEEATSQS